MPIAIPVTVSTRRIAALVLPYFVALSCFVSACGSPPTPSTAGRGAGSRGSNPAVPAGADRPADKGPELNPKLARNEARSADQDDVGRVAETGQSPKSEETQRPKPKPRKPKHTPKKRPPQPNLDSFGFSTVYRCPAGAPVRCGDSGCCPSGTHCCPGGCCRWIYR